MRRIDLNADLAEEQGDDDAIFPFLSSANIACGAHAGGARAMDAALALAARHAVTIGAHVGYPDRANFGRIDVDIERGALTTILVEQIGQLQDRAARHGRRVRYVKPHGALYHRVARDPEQAGALIDAVQATDPSLELLVPFSPILHTLAGTIPCRHEFFADRGYHLDGTLVGRTETAAHIVRIEAIVERTLRWLEEGLLTSVEGKDLRIEADSICIHGDSPLAVHVAGALHDGLVAHGVTITSWMAA